MVAIGVALAATLFGAAERDFTSCGASAPQLRVESKGSPPTRIWLQVITSTPITMRAIDGLVAEAAAVWAPYNVAVAVADGDLEEGRRGNRDGHVLKLFVRDAPTNRIDGRPSAGHAGLAAITFVDDVPERVLYASMKTALQMVKAARLNGLPEPLQERHAAKLLGRAVAHELGHYLLRSKGHAASGLMRVSFDRADLLATGHAAFRLSPEQVSTLSVGSGASCGTVAN